MHVTTQTKKQWKPTLLAYIRSFRNNMADFHTVKPGFKFTNWISKQINCHVLNFDIWCTYFSHAILCYRKLILLSFSLLLPVCQLSLKFRDDLFICYLKAEACQKLDFVKPFTVHEENPGRKKGLKQVLSWPHAAGTERYHTRQHFPVNFCFFRSHGKLLPHDWFVILDEPG